MAALLSGVGESANQMLPSVSGATSYGIAFHCGTAYSVIRPVV